MWLWRRHSRPTLPEVANRLLVLTYVIGRSVKSPPPDVLESMLKKWGPAEVEKLRRNEDNRRDALVERLRNIGLWRHASPKEKAILRSTWLTMTNQQRIDASWRLESAQVLMWALGMLPNLPAYDAAAEPDILKQVPFDDLPALVQSAAMRSAAEIDAARDVAELWHWRSRTRELIERGERFRATPELIAAGIGSFDDIIRVTAKTAAAEGLFPACIEDDFPICGKAYRDLAEAEWSNVRSITAERHFALNWLCGYAPGNQWDKTPTNT
ncbi:MAG: DUF4272 domain-containing protein [Phycisphaerae bacterium]|jgi:hypothetical protein